MIYAIVCLWCCKRLSQDPVKKQTAAKPSIASRRTRHLSVCGGGGGGGGGGGVIINPFPGKNQFWGGGGGGGGGVGVRINNCRPFAQRCALGYFLGAMAVWLLVY